jgi:hypothetical protein
MHQFNGNLNLILAFFGKAIKLFGVPPGFILKFFGELFLIFLFSALISYIFKIDKRSRN